MTRSAKRGAILTAHPGAYAHYRFQVFAEILGMTERFGGGSVMRRHWQTPERLQALGLASGSWWYQKTAEKRIVRLGKSTGLFRPYVYALLALVLLVFTRRQRDVFALLTSGLLMELSLLPLSATPDYRYSHWLVVSCCLSAVMLIVRRSHEARDIARANDPCASSSSSRRTTSKMRSVDCSTKFARCQRSASTSRPWSSMTGRAIGRPRSRTGAAFACSACVATSGSAARSSRDFGSRTARASTSRFRSMAMVSTRRAS